VDVPTGIVVRLGVLVTVGVEVWVGVAVIVGVLVGADVFVRLAVASGVGVVVLVQVAVAVGVRVQEAVVVGVCVPVTCGIGPDPPLAMGSKRAAGVSAPDAVETMTARPSASRGNMRRCMGESFHTDTERRDGDARHGTWIHTPERVDSRCRDDRRAAVACQRLHW